MLLNNLFVNKKVKLGLWILWVLIIYQILITALVEVEKISPQSTLSDYKNAYWYSIVTLTTVGYGDLFPLTTHGRIIGGIFVLLSMVFYATVIGGASNIIANIKENKKLGYEGTSLSNHIVMIGWDDFGSLVADQLFGVGKKMGIITDNKTTVDFIKDKYKTKDLFVLFNDYKNIDLYKKINIELSSMVFINQNSDTDKLVTALNLKKHYPTLRLSVVLDNSELKETFIAAGVEQIILQHEISSKLLASYIFEPDVADYAESIMSFAKSDDDFDIKQFKVVTKNPYLNKTYEEAFFNLKMKYNGILIGISKNKEMGGRELIKNPAFDLKIELGDYLIVILNGRAHQHLSKIFNVEEGLIQ